MSCRPRLHSLFGQCGMNAARETERRLRWQIMLFRRLTDVDEVPCRAFEQNVGRAHAADTCLSNAALSPGFPQLRASSTSFDAS